MWASDRNDSEDLGDWIVQQEWSNGKIMTFGASADGQLVCCVLLCLYFWFCDLFCFSVGV